MHKTLVKNNFSRASTLYNQHSFVQKNAALQLFNFWQNFLALQYCKMSQNHKHIQKILEIGAGTGHLSTPLLHLYPKNQIMFNDISVAMLTQLQNNIGPCQTIEADAETYMFQSYDLIISNMTFQWFAKLSQTIQRLKKLTSYLCFSVPVRGSYVQWEKLCEAYNIPYTLHTTTDTEIIKQLCHNEGWQYKIHEQIINIEYKTPLDFLYNFKNIGAQTTVAKQTIGLNQFKRLKLLNTPFNVTHKIAYYIIYNG